MIGQVISHYRVTAKLGAGGMGEVYRATDTKLGRDVALKVLPEAFAQDVQRMQRFQREAQLLAALNHPAIATIHGLEESGGTRALVMELVEGPTLAERIAAGAIPASEALPIAKQIAEALEYAHDHGIIHRDLKPANIKLTAEGKVKVLDFGLAKAMAGDSSADDISNSPTLTMAATKAGIILGTAAYMSPEQARGKPADRRADIWAFGVVLYEMLAGQQAYGGETASDSMAAIITREPNWSLLPSSTPPGVRRLLRRCLTKEARQRLQAIGDARISLEEALSSSGPTSEEAAVPAVAPGSPLRSVLPWALAGLLAIVAGVAVWRASRPVPVPVERFSITLPVGAQIDPGPAPTLAISPDGSQVAFNASISKGWQLHLRSMNEFEPVPVAGVQTASSPFFSPDGKWLGFFSGGSIKKVPVPGGTAQTVCDVPGLTEGRGATWGPDGTIVFSGVGTTGLQQVSTQGGKPKELTRPDVKNGETRHRLPHFLPGGRAILFTVEPTDANYNSARIAVLSLETGKWETLIEGGMDARYSPTGHLIFARGEALLAAPFDLDKLRVTGPAVPVVEGIVTNASTGVAMFDVSQTGTLIYMPLTAQSFKRELLWVDRNGKAETIPAAPADFDQPSLSPTLKKIAVHVPEGGNDVWTYDLARGTLTRITFQTGEDESPVWTPDGRRVIYSSSVGSEPRAIFWKNGDGSGVEERIATVGNHVHISSVSPDGKLLVLTNYETESRGDIWFLPLAGDHTAKPFLNTPFNEREGRISPDGRWIAYASDESGRDEVYVQSLTGGGKWQISVDGGFAPQWARNAAELFYRNGSRMMAVFYSAKPDFSPAPPRTLFEGRFDIHARREGIYDVSPEGKRFLMVKPIGGELGLSQLHVVVNWSQELKAH